MSDPNATVIVPEPPPLGRLAQYELLRKVGAGAMGEVYLARDTDLDRRVAIKLLHGEGLGRPRQAHRAERFLREARTAAQLVHPNVAVVYQVGRDGDNPFIVMEWLDGTDLGRWVDTQGPMPWREAVRALADAAAGLAAAHDAGLVHRDIKPSNLMRLADGRVKLVDFGLARWHGLASDLTAVGGVMGTPGYLSPEQCWGEEATPQSDLYALGCTLHYLLTGRLPFDADSFPALAKLHVEAPMPDPRNWAPDVPETVVGVMVRAAAKQPEDRHPGARALHDELLQLLEGGRQPVSAAARAATTFVPGRGAAAPAPPPAPPPGNLPVDVTSFVGRALQVMRARAMLDHARLLTFTGPGGTGKTRLSLQVAREAAPTLADGSWWVELTTVPAGSPIDSTLAAALGVPEVAGRPLARSVIDHLRAKSLLLVIDNCEQVVTEAAQFTAQLLAAASGVRVLATSRQPLGVAGEVVLPVPPLGLGSNAEVDVTTGGSFVAEPATLGEAAASEAVQLFAARARAVRPDFVLDDGNIAAVVAICRRLDGIPLAIELAAARVKVLAPAQIEARLGDALKLLVGGQRTPQTRQQTLRALFDWSWDLLGEQERLAFARLAIFRGSFDLEAAEAVLPDDTIEAWHVLDLLSELVDRSLVIAGDSGGTMRYRLLQTTQQYAADRLGAGDAVMALRRRHAVHYAGRLQAQAALLDGKQHAAAMAAIGAAADNANAALEAATAARWHEAALPLASALAAYWFAKGRAVDGLARLEPLLGQPIRPSEELALLLKRAGSLALFVDRRLLAHAWLDRGLAIARAYDDHLLESELLRGLGNLAFRELHLDRAQQRYLGAIEAARRAGNRLAEGKARHNLAAVAAENGRFEVARDHLLQALQIEREAGEQRGQAETLRNLALCEFELGNDAAAAGHFDTGLRIQLALGDAWGAAYTRWQIGRCALERGHLERSREAVEPALAAARQFDDRGMVAYLLDLLALIELREGRRAAARVHAREALALRRRSEAVEDVAHSLVTFAELNLDDDAEASARLLAGAAALRAQRGAPLQPRKQAAVDRLAQQVAGRVGATRYEVLVAEGREVDHATWLERLGAGG